MDSCDQWQMHLPGHLFTPEESSKSFNPILRFQKNFPRGQFHSSEDLEGKTILPLLKTFVWRLIRMAFVTTEIASRFTSHIDKRASCGAIENDAHLFFLCTLPQQVWANSNTPLSPHQIKPDLDGVHHIIP
jgi:hypothetical protein